MFIHRTGFWFSRFLISSPLFSAWFMQNSTIVNKISTLFSFMLSCWNWFSVSLTTTAGYISKTILTKWIELSEASVGWLDNRIPLYCFLQRILVNMCYKQRHMSPVPSHNRTCWKVYEVIKLDYESIDDENSVRSNTYSFTGFKNFVIRWVYLWVL